MTDTMNQVREALGGIDKAIGGLSIAEVEIREAIGNTNWNALQHHREKCRAALSLLSRPAPDPEP